MLKNRDLSTGKNNLDYIFCHNRATLRMAAVLHKTLATNVTKQCTVQLCAKAQKNHTRKVYSCFILSESAVTEHAVNLQR